MKEYAVIVINHRQYIVEPGKQYTVDKLAAEEGAKLEFPVITFVKADKINFQPKMTAKVEIVEQGKGEKIKSMIYRAKSRYRKRFGHRQKHTSFKVVSID